MGRKSRRLVTVALASLALMGCARGDARLKKLTVGISKDSALAAIGVTLGERPASYLVKGQMIEAMMIRRPDAEGPLDSLTHAQYTPVVIVDGKLGGWGWKYWDSVAKAIGVTQ